MDRASAFGFRMPPLVRKQLRLARIRQSRNRAAHVPWPRTALLLSRRDERHRPWLLDNKPACIAPAVDAQRPTPRPEVWKAMWERRPRRPTPEPAVQTR